jgi:hypothetical protein
VQNPLNFKNNRGWKNGVVKGGKMWGEQDRIRKIP